MKKLISLLSFTLLFLVGCSTINQPSSTDHKKHVTVTTSFIADMVKQLAGDLITIDTIIPAGEDPHLYVAKTGDLKKLQEANLILYHGLDFEGKMTEALEPIGKPVTENFPKERLTTLDEDGKIITDPHFWFDIFLYKKAIENVSLYLQSLLPEKTNELKQNTAVYLQKLDELDLYIKTELNNIPESSRYLITPHDAFNYFSKNYNIKVHAPQGISTDSEVSNADMIETVNLIIAHKIKAIFTESTTNPERMQKLQEAVSAKGGNVTVVTGEHKELFSDSLASLGERGDNYIDMYKHNVDLIVTYLK